jgi:hypothetical protein
MLLLCRRACNLDFHNTQVTIGNPISCEQCRAQSHSVYPILAVCDECYAEFPVANFFRSRSAERMQVGGTRDEPIVEARF